MAVNIVLSRLREANGAFLDLRSHFLGRESKKEVKGKGGRGKKKRQNRCE